MDEEIYLDTDELHEYASQLRKQKVKAQELVDELNILKLTSDQRFWTRYDGLMGDARKLIQYFSMMADTIEKLSDGAASYSLMARHMLEDSLATNLVREILQLD